MNTQCPFGTILDGRTFSSAKYRYGFNGMEKDDEAKGAGNQLDFGARIYDPRLGRWLSIDPHAKKYAGESPYVYVADNPLFYVDQDGKDKNIYFVVIDKNGESHNMAIRKIDNGETESFYSEGSWGNQYFAVYDVKQVITVDLRLAEGKQVSVSETSADFSSRSKDYEQDFSGYLASKFGLPGDGPTRGKQNDGFNFTSAFASEIDGAKTDSKNNPKQVNIDLVMAAVGAVGKSTKTPELLTALGPAKLLNNLTKIGKESGTLTPSSSPPTPIGVTCDKCGTDTFDLKEAPAHTGKLDTIYKNND